jgi:hypothetical protein
MQWNVVECNEVQCNAVEWNAERDHNHSSPVTATALAVVLAIRGLPPPPVADNCADEEAVSADNTAAQDEQDR